MERLARFPRGALTVSAIVTTMTAIAIFAFGVPAWILLPTTLIAGTLHTEMSSRVKRRHARVR
jgi:predicted PurR-regulated permease PerM